VLICTERHDINKRCLETKPQKESAILRYFPAVSSLLLDALCTVLLEVKCLKRGRKPKEEGKARKEGKFSCIWVPVRQIKQPTGLSLVCAFDQQFSLHKAPSNILMAFLFFFPFILFGTIFLTMWKWWTLWALKVRNYQSTRVFTIYFVAKCGVHPL